MTGIVNHLTTTQCNVKCNEGGYKLIQSLMEQIKLKDEQLASKDEQIATLEQKIVNMSLELASSKTSEGALEDKLVHMSLENASLKAIEDYHEHKLATHNQVSCQRQQEQATTVEEETTSTLSCNKEVQQLQRKWTPARQQSRRQSPQVSSLDHKADSLDKAVVQQKPPTCMARLQDEVVLDAKQQQQQRPKKFSRSLGDMLQSLNPQSARRRSKIDNNKVTTGEESRTESSSRSSSFQSISSQNKQQSVADSDRQTVVATRNGSVVILASKECRKMSMGTSDVVDWD